MKKKRKLNKWKNVLSNRIEYNAKDIHAIAVGISVVIITTMVEFLQRHIFKIEASGMIYGALGITLTSRIIGVFLRRIGTNPDEPKRKPRKRRTVRRKR